jgi:hypothetical protein
LFLDLDQCGLQVPVAGYRVLQSLKRELVIDDLRVLFDQLGAHVLRRYLEQPFDELDAFLLIP